MYSFLWPRNIKPGKTDYKYGMQTLMAAVGSVVLMDSVTTALTAASKTRELIMPIEGATNRGLAVRIFTPGKKSNF